MNQNFCRQHKLTTASEFSSVFKEADFRQSNHYLLMLGNFSEKPVNRLGMIISKKNIPRSVDRNRIKRMMREVFRKQTNFPNSRCIDVVLLIRKRIPKTVRTSLYGILNEQLCNLIEKAKSANQRSPNANGPS